LDHRLGFRSFRRKIFNNDKPLLTSQLGKNHLQGSAIHLLVDFLAVILRLGREDNATTTPQRRANRAGTGATSTLLTPRLLTATPHFSAGFLRTRTLPTSRDIRSHHQANQNIVVPAIVG